MLSGIEQDKMARELKMTSAKEQIHQLLEQSSSQIWREIQGTVYQQVYDQIRDQIGDQVWRTY